MVERTSAPTRVVFFGSPLFAVPILWAIAGADDFNVVLAVTQGPKAPSPVELAARELGIPIYKPATLRDAQSREPLVAAAPDLFVVAAFGLIFRQRTLEIPRLGSINVHPSLLPRYRGATPIPAAIEMGDFETGVSLMIMDAGIDTGAVVSIERASVSANDTAESLGGRLAELGAAQAVRDIPRWAAGTLTAVPQEQHGASLTRTLTKADGWLDWSRPAAELERHVRAMWPWPRAWTTVDGIPLQVHETRVLHQVSEPGAIIPDRKRLIVGAGDGALELIAIEPAGRRAMTGAAYLNGIRKPLQRLGDQGAPAPTTPWVRPIES